MIRCFMLTVRRTVTPGVIGGRGGSVRVSATTSFGVGMAFLSDLQGFSVFATSVTTATVRGS